MAKSPNTDSALFRIGYFYGLGKEARLVAFFFCCNFRSIQKLASSDAGKLWPEVTMYLGVTAQETSGVRIFY